MERSQKGLAGLGEWETLRTMLPDFSGKRVLDLGCGYGWHCRYAAEHGAKAVIGIDSSWRMLDVARQKNQLPTITYLCQSITDLDFPDVSFDIVISSLAFHYSPSFEEVVLKIANLLIPGGFFIFSVEHPIFTAAGSQDWTYDEFGNRLHFPVDNYFYEGKRMTIFLGEPIKKYHRTLTSYVEGILNAGLELLDLKEPMPLESMRARPDMADEMRRPMMLILSARKAI